jgi:hypothetical protein
MRVDELIAIPVDGSVPAKLDELASALAALTPMSVPDPVYFGIRNPPIRSRLHIVYVGNVVLRNIHIPSVVLFDSNERVVFTWNSLLKNDYNTLWRY